MQLQKAQMIAKLVKEKRMEFKYTQQELADLSNLSLRSIQRIEKGEVVPRMHSLKALSECLNFSLDFLDSKDSIPTGNTHYLWVRKLILSIVIISTTLLLSAAFIAQSANFPETDFEFYIYYALVFALIGFALLFLWKSTNRNSDSKKDPS